MHWVPRGAGVEMWNVPPGVTFTQQVGGDNAWVRHPGAGMVGPGVGSQQKNVGMCCQLSPLKTCCCVHPCLNLTTVCINRISRVADTVPGHGTPSKAHPC